MWCDSNQQTDFAKHNQLLHRRDAVNQSWCDKIRVDRKYPAFLMQLELLQTLDPDPTMDLKAA